MSWITEDNIYQERRARWKSLDIMKDACASLHTGQDAQLLRMVHGRNCGRGSVMILGVFEEEERAIATV